MNITTILLVPFALIGMSGCVSLDESNAGSPRTVWPTIEAKSLRIDGDSCYVTYTLTNTLDKTYSMRVEAFALNADGNTLGSGSYPFPPTLPGKQSSIEVPFYGFQMAPGACHQIRTVRAKGTFCQLVDTGDFLVDRICNGIVNTSNFK
jgi:hypothetical protein